MLSSFSLFLQLSNLGRCCCRQYAIKQLQLMGLSKVSYIYSYGLIGRLSKSMCQLPLLVLPHLRPGGGGVQLSIPPVHCPPRYEIKKSQQQQQIQVKSSIGATRPRGDHPSPAAASCNFLPSSLIHPKMNPTIQPYVSLLLPKANILFHSNFLDVFATASNGSLV